MCHEASCSAKQRKSFPTSFISKMKPLNKGAKRRTQGLLICLIAFIITANFPWAPGRELFPALGLISPSTWRATARAVPARPGGAGAPRRIVRRPGARRRDGGGMEEGWRRNGGGTPACQREAAPRLHYRGLSAARISEPGLFRGAN